MPVASVGDQRWEQVGTKAGNRVFARNRSGVSRDDATKADLEAELEKRGLPKSGTKDELIERLNEADAEA